MIYLVIHLTLFVGISFIVWYAHRQDKNPDTPVRPFLNGFSTKNIRPIREEFLDNYIWICDIFGVGTDIRGEGKTRLRSSNRDFDIFFVHNISEYGGHYPRNMQRPSVKVSWSPYDVDGFIKFMKEFNNIVLQYRKDNNTISEIKELGISPAEYLKPVNKHQPEHINLD